MIGQGGELKITLDGSSPHKVAIVEEDGKKKVQILPISDIGNNKHIGCPTSFRMYDKQITIGEFEEFLNSLAVEFTKK